MNFKRSIIILAPLFNVHIGFAQDCGHIDGIQLPCSPNYVDSSSNEGNVW